jgi:hypothetical protein
MSEFYELHRYGMRLKFLYSMAGLVLGLSCVIAGVVLGVAGASGSIKWTGKLFGFSSELSNATPGAVISVVGIFLVLVTRFKVIQTTNDQETRSPLLNPLPQNAPQVSATNVAKVSSDENGSGSSGDDSRFETLVSRLKSSKIKYIR